MLQMRKLAPWLLLFGIAALHAEVPALNGSLGRWLVRVEKGPHCTQKGSRHSLDHVVTQVVYAEGMQLEVTLQQLHEPA